MESGLAVAFTIMLNLHSVKIVFVWLRVTKLRVVLNVIVALIVVFAMWYVSNLIGFNIPFEFFASGLFLFVLLIVIGTLREEQ